jgi:hypothetical protein
MTFWKRLKYLLPSYRHAQERDMSEELQSLAAIAEAGELGNLTRAAEEARAVWVNCTRRQLLLLKQLGLIFANVLQA